MSDKWREQLSAGQVIPACPLALSGDGTWSPRHQRAILRYYMDAGAGGIAVGVHTTQFAIRQSRHGLYEPVLKLVSEMIDREFKNQYSTEEWTKSAVMEYERVLQRRHICRVAKG